jgi:hypothetical protein
MNGNISWKYVLPVFAVVLFALGTAVYHISRNSRGENLNGKAYLAEPKVASPVIQAVSPTEPKNEIKAVLPTPPPPSMERMKREGCIVDGLLNGDYPGDGKMVSLINRSKCYFLSRAVETWLAPPDWDTIDENHAKLRDGFLPGMFLAEAIDTGADYFYMDENRKFDFGDMCRPGSKNFWGEHTCKPSFSQEEYRKYLRFITRQAMDRNVQVFLFGQIYLQDANDLAQTLVPGIIAEMRNYASLRDMKIFVGAQTNDIADPKYLKLFDFIEGGVGIDESGSVEKGPCFSRWWKQEGDWCWGLLWNDRFAKNANNVFLHLDWSGQIGDDMSVFTQMDQATRARTLLSLHKYFTDRNMGFLLPYLTRLHVDNGGCYGPSRHFYTPDKRLGCDDEVVIDTLGEAAFREQITGNRIQIFNDQFSISIE